MTETGRPYFRCRQQVPCIFSKEHFRRRNELILVLLLRFDRGHFWAKCRRRDLVIDSELDLIDKALTELSVKLCVPQLLCFTTCILMHVNNGRMNGVQISGHSAIYQTKEEVFKFWREKSKNIKHLQQCYCLNLSYIKQKFKTPPQFP